MHIWGRSGLNISIHSSSTSRSSAAMEDEGRWMIKTISPPRRQMPDFRDYIYTKGLRGSKAGRGEYHRVN